MERDQGVSGRRPDIALHRGKCRKCFCLAIENLKEGKVFLFWLSKCSRNRGRDMLCCGLRDPGKGHTEIRPGSFTWMSMVRTVTLLPIVSQ